MLTVKGNHACSSSVYASIIQLNVYLVCFFAIVQSSNNIIKKNSNAYK